MKHLSLEIRKFYKNNNPILILEIIFLSLMIASLPSLEAPKNIFLVFFIVLGTAHQIQTKAFYKWHSWDWVFSIFIGCAFLSTLFAGYPQGSEWSGFRMLLTYSLTGWLLSRTQFSEKQVTWLFWLTIFSTFPPLIWGLIQYLFLNTKSSLQLHSVGHANHSAIYLCIIFGASLGLALTSWNKSSLLKKIVFLIPPFFLFESIIISASRAAFIVAILIFIIIISTLKNNIKTKILLIVVFFGLVLIPTFSQSDLIKKQKQAEANNNVLSNRNLVWNVAAEMIRIHPLFGIGMNNWKLITLEEIKESTEKRNKQFNPENYLLKAGHAHNLYLQATLERGLIGLASIIMLLIYWLKALISQFQEIKENKLKSMLWAGSISAWLATFLIGLVNSTFHHEHAILSCLLLGFFIQQLKKGHLCGK